MYWLKLNKIVVYICVLASNLSKIEAIFWPWTKISFGFKSHFAEAINISLFWNYSVSHLHLKAKLRLSELFSFKQAFMALNGSKGRVKWLKRYVIKKEPILSNVLCRVALKRLLKFTSIMRVENGKGNANWNLSWTPGKNKRWTRAGFEVRFRTHGSQFYFTAIINCKTSLNCFLGLFLEQKGQSHTKLIPILGLQQTGNFVLECL